MDLDNKNINNQANDISTSDIVLDILTKYNLKENEEDLTKKYFGGNEDTNGGILFWAASELAAKKDSEKKLVSILTEKLSISSKVAEQIIEEIKKNLLPILKMPKGLIQHTDEEKKESPIKPTEIARTFKDDTKIEEIKPAPAYKKRERIIKKFSVPETKKTTTQTEQPKNQDAYRESVN